MIGEPIKQGTLIQRLEINFSEETKEFLLEIFKQEPRAKGKWVRNDNGTYSCSICQAWIPEEQHYYAKYCLYCGADMRGEIE